MKFEPAFFNSSFPTLFPIFLRDMAKFTAKVDLPTPPFPLAIAIIFLEFIKNLFSLFFILAGLFEVKTTLITDEYTIEDFYEKYGVDNAAVLFVLDSNGRLHINSAHEPHDVKTGDTVIAIVGLPVPDDHISKPSTSH